MNHSKPVLVDVIKEESLIKEEICIKEESCDEVESILNKGGHTLKRRLSTSGSFEDDECKIPKLEGSSANDSDPVIGDDNELNSSNEDEVFQIEVNSSDEEENSTSDPLELDNILSVKKMELLQHPEVISFLKEKIDQSRKKSK